MKKHECDYVVMINTTSPLIKMKTLTDFVTFVSENDFDTVLSVVSEKAETFYNDLPLNFSLAEKINSQFLPPVEKIVWALTAWKRETFISLQKKGINPIFGGKIGRFEIPKDESCDLDTQEDWNIAEGILKARELKHEERFLELS
jgi:CMP-N-acetylneuraminic acid synthetase